MAADDWRRSSPGVARGAHFHWNQYLAPKPAWDHDHCLFCWAKFVPEEEKSQHLTGGDEHTIYSSGYATVEAEGSGSGWVCRPCFEDFADELGLVVEDSSAGPASAEVAFGCDFCRDDQNRLFGHLDQIDSDERRRMFLLQCPRCGALYENSARGQDQTRRLTKSEAEQLYPGSAPLAP